jgi:hypothetical protein
MEDRGSIPDRGTDFVTMSIPALGPTQTSIQWVPGSLSPGVKRQGREAGHSPPLVKHRIRLHGVVLS